MKGILTELSGFVSANRLCCRPGGKAGPVPFQEPLVKAQSIGGHRGGGGSPLCPPELCAERNSPSWFMAPLRSRWLEVEAAHKHGFPKP